jgi:hypothetical protein
MARSISGRAPRTQLPLTVLEDRALPTAAVTATLTGDVLRVTDWSSGDTLTLRQTPSGVVVESTADGSQQAFVGVGRVVMDVQSDTRVVNDTSGLGGASSRGIYLARRDVTGLGFATTGALGLDPPPIPVDDGPPPQNTGDWFDSALSDADVTALARSLASDRTLDRIDMLRLFAEVASDNVVSAAEYHDLTTLVTVGASTAPYSMPDAVRQLASDVVGHDPANGSYQGATLGDLSPGSSGIQLNNLVNKWFLGLDHPKAMASAQYRRFSGPLFVGGPSPQDVFQGRINDCYFLAALAAVAQNDPQAIRNMFTDNGDGTYAVRFFRNGVANYVTVDSSLPNLTGTNVYADFGGRTDGTAAELWVALAEKAYAQINESGWIGQDGTNTYAGIAEGYGDIALQQITGRPATFTWIIATSADRLLAALNAGRPTILDSRPQPGNGVVGSHAYALTGYDPSDRTFTVYNPWGSSLRLTWNQIQTSFYGIWQSS